MEEVENENTWYQQQGGSGEQGERIFAMFTRRI